MGWPRKSDGGWQEYSPEGNAGKLRGSIHQILQPLPRGDGTPYRQGVNMSEQDRPPLFGTWRKAYVFTIALFALEVALLYAFTLRFS